MNRIAAIVLLGPDLDAHYERRIGKTWNWQAAFAEQGTERTCEFGPRQNGLFQGPEPVTMAAALVPLESAQEQ